VQFRGYINVEIPWLLLISGNQCQGSTVHRCVDHPWPYKSLVLLCALS